MLNIPKVELLISLFFFALVYILFGYYFNGYSATVSMLLLGFLSDQPFTQTYYVCCIAQNFVLKFLFDHITSINWYSISLILNYFLALVLWLKVFDHFNLFYKKTSNRSFGLLVFGAFVLDDVIFLEHTYSTSLLFVLIFSSILINNKQNLWQSLITLIIGSISILERYDTTFLTFLFLLGIAFILFPKLIFERKRLMGGFLIIFLLITGGFAIDKSLDNQHFKKIEPDVYFVSMGNLLNDAQMSNEKYNIKLEAIKNDLYNDEENITAEFIHSLVDVKNKSIQLFFNSKQIFSEYLVNAFSNSPIFFYLLFIFLIFSFINNFSYKKLISFAFLFIGVFILTVLIKMEDRVLKPLLIGVVLLFLVFDKKEIKSDNILIKLSIVFAFLANLIFCFFKLDNHKLEVEKKKAFITELTSKTDEILIDGTSADILSWDAFNLYKNLDANFYTVEMGQLTLVPQYQKFIAQKCSCNSKSSKDVYTYLKNNEGAIYLSTPNRIRLIKDYNSIIYGLDLKFEPLELKTSYKNIYPYLVR